MRIKRIFTEYIIGGKVNYLMETFANDLFIFRIELVERVHSEFINSECWPGWVAAPYQVFLLSENDSIKLANSGKISLT